VVFQFGGESHSLRQYVKTAISGCPVTVFPFSTASVLRMFITQDLIIKNYH